MARVASAMWGLTGWLAALLARPSVAAACAVCGSSQSEENQTAYLVTTGFLTFLPLIGVGLIVLWIRKRVRELEAAEVPMAGEPSGLAAVRSTDE